MSDIAAVMGRDLILLGYTVGKWTENVRHAEPCDCDEDNETVGDRCMANSVWCWALLKDEGGFAPSFAFALSRLQNLDGAEIDEDDPPMVAAQKALGNALMSLGGESPWEVYDAAGAAIWLHSTVRKIKDALDA